MTVVLLIDISRSGSFRNERDRQKRDLIAEIAAALTCSSPKSRNYQVGYALGQGLSSEEAVTRLGEVVLKA